MFIDYSFICILNKYDYSLKRENFDIAPGSEIPRAGIAHKRIMKVCIMYLI